MKQIKSPYARQNDKTAITLFKASYRCLRNERIAKYIMIVLSFGICLAAIFNKYLPQMASGVENITEIQSTAATYINLISGLILVIGIVVGFYTTRMHTEGTVLQDRYDSYVFDNPPNLSILRPIPQTVINVYAHKTRKKDEAFRDNLFDSDSPIDADTAQFDYINATAHSDYRLYLSIQPFFLTLWIGFCVIIILLAISFNDAFVTTLINIMIPSLSAITTIGNSWYNCRLQMKQLQNLLTVIDQIQRLPEEKRLAYIKDKRNVRALADGLFNYRVSPFVIPNFLVRRHLRTANDQSISITLDKSSPKTEMPTLVLPDLDAAVTEINEILNYSEPKTVTFSRTHTVTDVTAGSKRYKTPSRVSAKKRTQSAAPAQETHSVKEHNKEATRKAATEPDKSPVKPAKAPTSAVKPSTAASATAKTAKRPADKQSS